MECSVMDERLRFVARLLEGEAMSEVCRYFGISRKTGYKILNRYREHGVEALCDRSRRPWRYANQLPLQVESLIVRAKREKPHWGARKIRELLVKRLAGDVRIPAQSTVHAVLDRHGLVKRAKTRRNKAMGTTLSDASQPNALWCADFKGEFRLGNREYCYPLTVTDQASRFILMCEALQSTREEGAFTAFQRLFAERRLPEAIRTDNGLPFASPNGLYNLSKLSVWWLRLGIAGAWPECAPRCPRTRIVNPPSHPTRASPPPRKPLATRESGLCRPVTRHSFNGLPAAATRMGSVQQ
jgi:transposase InsO family protein